MLHKYLANHQQDIRRKILKKNQTKQNSEMNLQQ